DSPPLRTRNGIPAPEHSHFLPRERPSITMKVLVTGASGFIGRPLVLRLVARGHRVRGLVRRAHEAQALTGAEIEVGDVRDAGAVDRATRGMDVVVHLACATGVARASVAREVNVLGTRRVL